MKDTTARVKATIRHLSDKKLVLENQPLLSQLSEQRRKVLTGLYIEGKTQEEIATELKIPQSAVSQHKTAGLERLRGLVDPDRALVTRNQDLLTQLSEQQRKVLTGFYIEGKKGKAIATELKIPHQVVSYHKRAGLERLRGLVDPDSDYQLVIRNTQLLEHLSEQQRKVLTGLYIEGKTGKAIARELKITRSAVYQYKRAGLGSLRRWISIISIIKAKKSKELAHSI